MNQIIPNETQISEDEVERDMRARRPRTTYEPDSPTPGGLSSRIRCKLCRRELARSERIIGHGQLVAVTPAIPISSTHLPLRTSLPSMPSITPIQDAVLPTEAQLTTTQHPATEPFHPQANPPPSGLPSMGDPPRPSDITAHLFTNPKLAALRSPTSLLLGHGALRQTPPPILANSKCSGYFLEPMKWMEPFLSEGRSAGKIMCPNQSCGAKLGNYDWSGVHCGCDEWITPGFCIHRSKVDEIV
ncbi:hypothetical protein JAAARDRAFT_283993 [Jaapia argillacea MUCL 33604]|uniref:protein-tyrosine-phosphatase n=1 Tax=Jaapia argillacea MUCL 33604 TaxID=933084 RepID=A0A067PQL3_9AGAM|nr:hypothetical protein JAAARDRAFT_283993 [Jaapia argillacea MUCL 33604]